MRNWNRKKLPVRYQAAIVRDDHLLMLNVWDHKFTGEHFWLIPGGGRIDGESEEECVQREALEETNLQVEVGPCVMDEPDIPEGMYERVKTFTCQVKGGEARPGTEPEVDTEDKSTISAIGWFDLRNPQSWDKQALEDASLVERLERLRAALGYEGNK